MENRMTTKKNVFVWMRVKVLPGLIVIVLDRGNSSALKVGKICITCGCLSCVKNGEIFLT